MQTTTRTITLQQLLEMSLGSRQITPENLGLLHCLIVTVMQKLNCEQEIVKIVGLEGKCLLKLLKESKDPPLYVYGINTAQTFSKQFEKLEYLENCTKELSTRLEDHLHARRSNNIKFNRLFAAKLWDRYAEPLEDLCSYHGRRTAEFCKELATNVIFIQKLRSLITQPVVQRIITFENRVNWMCKEMKSLNNELELRFERSDFIKPIIMKLEMMRKDIEDNHNTFLEAVDELQEMFDAKLDRTSLPALKNYLKIRFKNTSEMFDTKHKEIISCLPNKPLDVDKIRCLSCGGKNKFLNADNVQEVDLCHHCTQVPEVKLRDRLKALNRNLIEKSQMELKLPKQLPSGNRSSMFFVGNSLTGLVKIDAHQFRNGFMGLK